jgi:phage shock protein C
MDYVGGLQRSTRDKWLLGVCGGIARQYGWRSGYVRLAAVVLAIIIPGPSLILSFLVYLALGALLPKSEEF